MSLTSTIELAVNSAFSAVDDLAKDAVLYKNNITGFNFSTGQATSSGATQLPVKVIPYERTQKEDDNFYTFHSDLVSVIIKDTVDLTLYEEIGFDSNIYRIEGYERYPGIYVLFLRGK